VYVLVIRLIRSPAPLTEVVSPPPRTEKSATQPIDAPSLIVDWRPAFNETHLRRVLSCCFSLLLQKQDAFPDSNVAMAVAFLDPHISNEAKRLLAQLIDASPLTS
jgi:hypothetical protein